MTITRLILIFGMQSEPVVTWKKSPVKTFFPEEFKRGSAGDGRDPRIRRNIQLHQDDEIYSMLLSRASASFFDDDNDHTPVSKAATDDSHLPGTPTAETPDYARTGAESSANNSSIEIKGVSMKGLHGPFESHQSRGMQAGEVAAISAPAAGPPPSVFEGMEYKRNDEVFFTDYQLLQYIDFLKEVECEFPTTADVRNVVEFSSAEVMANAVADKVIVNCFQSEYVY